MCDALQKLALFTIALPVPTLKANAEPALHMRRTPAQCPDTAIATSLVRFPHEKIVEGKYAHSVRGEVPEYVLASCRVAPAPRCGLG